MSSIYKDKKGYTYYQVWTYHNTTNGKKRKVQKSLGKNKTKSQLKNEVQVLDKFYEKEDRVFKTRGFKKPTHTIQTLYQMYIDNLDQKLLNKEISKTTRRFGFENTKNFIEYYVDVYGNKNIDYVSTTELERYKQHRIGLGLSVNTIRINLRGVRGLFNWIVDEGYLTDNPFKLKIPTYIPRDREKIPTPTDFKKIRRFITNSIFDEKKIKSGLHRIGGWWNNNDWFRYMVFFGMKTGMRGGEIRILEWNYNPEIHRPDNRVSYSYLSNDWKTITIFFKGTENTIPVSNDIRKVLNILDKKKSDRGDFVFQNPTTKEPYEKSRFNKCFRELMIGLGLKDNNGKSKYKFHSIRHGVVSELINSGVPMGQVSKLLRHTDIRTTMNIYYHLVDDELKGVMDIL